MDEIIKNLKEELLNKKMTLLEMDNETERISGSPTSLFDYPDEIRRNGSANYYIEDGKEIVVEYETNLTDEEIENMNSEEKLDIEVTVTDVYKY